MKKFSLSQRGRRLAARGLSCELGKASPQRIVTSNGANPRAFGAAPFFKGEFLATAGSGHFFTAPLVQGWMLFQPRQVRKVKG